MEYQGYKISEVKEKTLEPQGDAGKPAVSVTSYKVSVGDKVVAVGLPSTEIAKKVVDTRRAQRQRTGRLDPVG